MKQPDDYMTNQRRELFFRIIDNYKDIHSITHRLHFLHEHFPPEKLDRACKWLVQNGITGAKFLDWFKQACKSSDLEMHRLLLAILENENIAPLIAGRNFKV